VDKTPWFNAAKHNPPRVGLYECKCEHHPESGIILRRFMGGGSGWGYDSGVRPNAFGYPYRCDSWRGLTEEPK
jgi:hypothetical protein